MVDEARAMRLLYEDGTGIFDMTLLAPTPVHGACSDRHAVVPRHGCCRAHVDLSGSRGATTLELMVVRVPCVR